MTLQALERVELTLGDASAGVRRDVGRVSVDERDARRSAGRRRRSIRPGTFYWQPGPGFIGTFELLFVRTACDGSKEHLPVTVRIQTR